MSSLPPTSPKDWTLDHVITHLEKKKGKTFVKENGIREKLEAQKIKGISFLLLNEEMLSRKQGPYEFPHGIALEIMLIIGELNKMQQESE